MQRRALAPPSLTMNISFAPQAPKYSQRSQTALLVSASRTRFLA
jgi:hypothetical protein